MRRQRGTGRIYHQKGSSFWWIQYYRDGVLYRESTRTSCKHEAGKILDLRIGSVLGGVHVESAGERVRMAELAEDLLRDYRINERASIGDVETRWRLHLQPFFGYLLPSQITGDLLDRYVDQRLEKGAANATINRELAALKRMLNLRWGTTPSKVHYVPKFPRLAENNIRQGFLEEKQYEKLFTSCNDSWFQALVEAGCTYGWRIGELLTLKVDQVDLDHWTIRLHSGATKNKEGREVTMTPKIRDLFSRCIVGKSSHDFLFTRSNGKAVRDFRDSWDKVCTVAGVPQLLFHDLRRTAARNFRRAGVSESVIMKIAGWRTRSMFDRYAIVCQADVKDALHKLEEQKMRLAQGRGKDGQQMHKKAFVTLQASSFGPGTRREPEVQKTGLFLVQSKTALDQLTSSRSCLVSHGKWTDGICRTGESRWQRD